MHGYRVHVAALIPDVLMAKANLVGWMKQRSSDTLVIVVVSRSCCIYHNISSRTFLTTNIANLAISPAINNANSVDRNTAATNPIEIDIGLLSVALVFFLIVDDNVLLLTLSCRISFSRISSEVRLANSGSVEKFLNTAFKSLQTHPQFDVTVDTVDDTAT